MAKEIREHLQNVERTLEEKKERNKAQHDHCSKKTNRIM